MATLDNVGTCNVGNALTQFLLFPDILPGDGPSYEACKTVYLYHPLGQKMAERPVRMAQAKPRNISISTGPEERLVDAFNREWKALKADKNIRATQKHARIYGIASVAYLAKGVEADQAIEPKDLHKYSLKFNCFDPLNTAGSLVLNQNPNEEDFQKKDWMAVNGTTYHPSRSCIVMNEEPIYISYTSSAFGFVGRSVYQRAWYPLKSFLSTMVTNDMVARKAGLLVVKMKPAGSIVDKAMAAFGAQRRNMVKEAGTDNVLSIGTEEEIESLNMLNLEGPFKLARDNILKDIAAAGDMPAIMLDEETFARGMAEGTEDAKRVAAYIDEVREEMEPLYEFFDHICMWRAWTPAFYETIQKDFPAEYGEIPYETAVYQWINAFKAEWPSLLDEPPSEKIKTIEAKVKMMVDIYRIIAPDAPQEVRAELVQWMADNLNMETETFTTMLQLDVEAIADYEPPAGGELKEAPPPRIE